MGDSSEEALALAERLRLTLQTGTWTSRQLRATASFGVAIAPTQASTAAELVITADAALYEAKRLGRNYLRLAGEPPPPAPQPRLREPPQPPPAKSRFFRKAGSKSLVQNDGFHF